MSLLLCIDWELRFDEAPPARALRIADEFHKIGIKTIVAGIAPQNNKLPNSEFKIETTEKVNGHFARVRTVKKLVKNIENILKNENCKMKNEKILKNLSCPSCPSWLIIFKPRKHDSTKIDILYRDEICKMKNDDKIDSVIVRGHLLFSMLLPILKRYKIKNQIYDFHGFAFKEMLSERKISEKVLSIFMRHFEMKSVNNATLILSNSTGSFEQLSPQNQKKAIILTNGINPEMFGKKYSEREIANLKRKHRIPLNKEIVGFRGKIGSWIDIETIIETAKILDKLHFVIIGDGHGIKEKDFFSENVTYIKRMPQDDLILLQSAFDICINPLTKKYSHNGGEVFHGAPTRMREYAASGKPIIMANINGRENCFQEGKNVILYDPGNPKELAEKILYLLDNKKLKGEMEKNNLKLSEELTWKKVVEDSGILEFLTQGKENVILC